MAEDPSGGRPLLRPVLRFTKAPQPEAVQGGGKGRADIRGARLQRQIETLADTFGTLARIDQHFIDFNDRTLLCVSMFDDSFAPSWLPSGLFNRDRGARFVAPYQDGYLIEVDTEYLRLYPSVIRRASTVVDQVDISRVRSVRAFSAKDPLAGQSVDEIWEKAPERGGGRLFLTRLTPLRDRDAGEAMIKAFQGLRERIVFSPGGLLSELGDETLPITTEDRAFSIIRARGDRIAMALRSYRQSGRASTSVILKRPEDVEALVASGTVFRIDPSPRLVGAPGKSRGEPDRPLPDDLAQSPIVGVVDGGLTAESYRPAEAWAAPPLVRGSLADARHGNQVTSLIVQGHDWNGNLALPALYCRVGTAQALSKMSVGHEHAPGVDDLLAYVEAVMVAHPETQVWNFSMNQLEPCDPDQVSYIGHELAKLARKYAKLPVISVGNGTDALLKPPADCEASLTVGGHLACDKGGPGSVCPVSLPGPGPSGMLKPDVTNFSRVRAIGGAIVQGSSFATGLTSTLAAHTMMRLSDPSPDMVRALLIHTAHDSPFTPTTGFGSVARSLPPWECEGSSATLMWQEDLRPGAAFYWDVPVPPAMIKNGKLAGFAALTAVLNPHPLVDDLAGPNYFGARVNTALQYQVRGGYQNLLGKIETDQMPEMAARAQEHKWSPVRHHQKDFGARGRKFDGGSLQVFARVYVRDLYVFGIDAAAEVPGLSVSFVLTLKSHDQSDLYDQMVTDLREYVEPGIIDTDIQIEGGL